MVDFMVLVKKFKLVAESVHPVENSIFRDSNKNELPGEFKSK
jgi:hypothetical protein